MKNKINNDFWKNILHRKNIVLSQTNLILMQNILNRQVIKKDDYFLKAGNRSTQVGFITEGLFRSFYIDENGNDVTKYFYSTGGVLFAYISYLTDTDSSYDIQALEDSVVLVAQVSDFEKIIDGNYQLLLLYKQLIDEALIKKEEHAASFKLMNSAERYEHFLINNPELEKRVKQHQIASYLGITPVSLSRIRKKLKIIK